MTVVDYCLVLVAVSAFVLGFSLARLTEAVAVIRRRNEPDEKEADDDDDEQEAWPESDPNWWKHGKPPPY